MAEAQQKRRFYIPLLNFGSLTPSGSAEQPPSDAKDAGNLVPSTLHVPETQVAGPETLATTIVSSVTYQDNVAGDEKGVLQDCTEQVLHSDSVVNAPNPTSSSQEAQHQPLPEACQTATLPTLAKKPKRYAAAPRSFLKSSVKRSSLETGDVVSFSQEGKLFRVKSSGLDEETGKTRYHLDLSDNKGIGDDPSTHLEVVRQGNYLAFRSAVAEDRFLQARRRSNLLSFFNTNLGIYEQWELVEGQPVTEWNATRLAFRSRQHDKLVVTLDVRRVGSFIVAQNAHMTPRSFDMPTESGAQEVDRISQFAVQEHLRFIKKEKEMMVKMNDKLARLLNEKQELKLWAEEQVAELRQNVYSDLTEMEERLLLTEDELAKLWLERYKSIKYVIQAANHKILSRLRQQAFVEWRAAAAHRVHQKAMIQRQLERNNRRLVASCFHLWKEQAQARQLFKRRSLAMTARWTERISTTVFRAWAEHALSQRQLRALHLEAAEKGFERVQKQKMKAAFQAWQQTMDQRRILEHVANRMAESRYHSGIALVFDAWHCITQDAKTEAVAYSKSVKFYARRTMTSVFNVWRDRVAETRQKEEAATALITQKQSLLAAQLFQHWALTTAGRIQTQQLIDRALSRTKARTLTAILREWKTATEESQMRQHAATQLVVRLATSRMHAAFSAWRHHTSMARRARKIVAERSARFKHQMTAAAFSGLRDHAAEAKHLRALLTVYVNRRFGNTALAVFTAWSAVAAEKRRTRQDIAKFAARRQHAVLARCLAAFCEARDLAAEADLESERRARLHQRRMLRDLFSSWMCQAAMLKQERLDEEAEQRTQQLEDHSQELKVSRMRAACQQRVLRSLFSQWALSAAERQEDRCRACAALDRAKRISETRTKVNFFSAWARLLDQNDDIVDFIRYRSTQILVSAAFKHWRQAVDARAAWHKRALYMETRSYLELVKAAFAGWRQHVADKQAQKQVVDSFRTAACKRKLRSAFNSWHALAIDQKCLNIAGERIAARSKLSYARKVFQTWRKITVEHKEAAGKIHAVAVGMKLSWAASSAEGLLQRMSRFSSGSQDKALQLTALASWISFAQERKERRQLLSSALTRRGLQTLRSSLLAWHEQTGIQQVQEMKVVRGLSRLRISRMRTAFDKWQEVLAEQRSIHDRLRTCIAAKRISHRLYVKGYFESLDENVQETMQQLYAAEDDVQLPMMTPQPSMPPQIGGHQDDQGDRIAAHFGSKSTRTSPTAGPHVPPLKMLSRSGGSLGGLSALLAPGSDSYTQGRELTSQTLRGSLSARGPRPDYLALIAAEARPLGGSLTARGGLYARQSLEVPDRGSLTARVNSAAQRELDEDLADLRPRMSRSFAKLYNSNPALPSVVQAALVPLPEEHTNVDSEEERDVFSDNEGDYSDSVTSPAASSGARSIEQQAPPATFSPLGDHLYEAHRYELTPGGTQIQSHPTNLDEDTNSETSEFATAWGGPHTPADLDSMTPSYWAGAPATIALTSPPQQGRPTFSAVTPPAFHSGLLHIAEASQEPVRTPGPGLGTWHPEEPAP